MRPLSEQAGEDLMSLKSKTEVAVRDFMFECEDDEGCPINDRIVAEIVKLVRETDDAERSWAVARRNPETYRKLEISQDPRSGKPEEIAIEYARRNNYSDGNKLILIAADSI